MARTTARNKKTYVESDSDSDAFTDEGSEQDTSSKSKNKQAVKGKQRARLSSSGSDVEHDAPVVRSPLASVGNTNASAVNNGKQSKSSTKSAKRRISSKYDDLRRQSISNSARLAENNSNTSQRSSEGGNGSAAPNGIAPAQGQGGLRPPHSPVVSGMRVASGSRIAGLEHARGGAPRSSLSGLVSDTPNALSSENYEEWLKMATENKINTNNTWNITLIDYFHDMSLLRNADDENSINFTKASCTLDGCVKIWTSRVDSTATAVGKLMNGLANDGDADAADDDEGEGGSDNEANQERKKRKRATKINTLADNFSKIQQKQLDLEAAVDPLFKKTCADFDEGGASGILMNHLGLDRSMRIVFDASDSKLLDDKEEEEADKEDLEDDGQEMIDVTQLKANFLSNLTVPLHERHISPSLAGFKFSSDASALDLSLFNNLRSSVSGPKEANGQNEAILPGMANVEGLDVMGTPAQDFFADPDHNDEYGAQDFFDAGGDDGPDDGDEGHVQQVNGPPRLEMGSLRAGMHPSENELVMAMTGDPDRDDFFDYFDNAFVKNWAGPEHWRMHRAVPKKDKDESVNGAKPARKEKQAFSIDFSKPRETPIAEVFAKPKDKGPAILLKMTAADRNNTHLLPDDMHFSSAQLLSLFIKPKAWMSVRRRTRRNPFRQDDAIDINQEVDEHYWAQAAANNADIGDNLGDHDDDDDGPLPFNTQFMHDDENDLPDFPDEEIDMDVSNVIPNSQAIDAAEDDLLAATQGQTAKRARPEYVNFAKRAKRVDVKRLKENIWKELALPVTSDQSEKEDTDFTSVLSGLRKTYPKDKMDEISTSFCFICLLHLANENGLSIKATEEQDLEKAERAIGGLVDLQINRQ